MEVFEPAILSITIPDQRFTSSVEACFDANQLRVRHLFFFFTLHSQSSCQTFVAQCEDDYQTLNRLVVDTPEAIGRKARINTWFRVQPAQHSQPPLTTDQVRHSTLVCDCELKLDSLI